MTVEKKVLKIAKLLRKTYGKPGSRKTLPIDELIRTILSQNTNDKNSLAAFAILKKSIASWDEILKMNTRKIAGLIKHAGLASIKARRIKEALSEINRREGRLSLAGIARMDIESAKNYLMSIKGVGPKTAACVLLFSFGKPIMPVDTHIFRVAKRLGLLAKDAGIAEAHDILTNTIPKDLIYELHLGIISHGRKTCRAAGPKCGSCVLYGICDFELKRRYREKRQCQ